MTPEQAAWVRQHAWNTTVRTEAKQQRGSAVATLCYCQQPYTCDACTDDQHHQCDPDVCRDPHGSTLRIRLFADETVILGPAGRLFAPTAHGPGSVEATSMRVRLADRWCRRLCHCPCRTRASVPAVARPVRLDLFGAVA